MSQSDELLRYLRRNGSITRRQAFIGLGITELSARVIDLEIDGWTIPRHRITVRKRNGKVSVMKYFQPFVLIRPQAE